MIDVAPSSVLRTFIKIKLVSLHLLLYAVYACQNHLILSMRSLVTSKKCKLVPFNLPHSVLIMTVLDTCLSGEV